MFVLRCSAFWSLSSNQSHTSGTPLRRYWQKLLKKLNRAEVGLFYFLWNEPCNAADYIKKNQIEQYNKMKKQQPNMLVHSFGFSTIIRQYFSLTTNQLTSVTEHAQPGSDIFLLQQKSPSSQHTHRTTKHTPNTKWAYTFQHTLSISRWHQLNYCSLRKIVCPRLLVLNTSRHRSSGGLATVIQWVCVDPHIDSLQSRMWAAYNLSWVGVTAVCS
jgi:hypothetical protein